MHDDWNLYESAGSRYPWLVSVANWAEQRDEAIYLSDYWNGWCDNDSSDSAEWQAAEMRWAAVQKCVRQCEAMLAVMPASRAGTIVEQHRAGLVPLYREVRDALRKCGVRFVCDTEAKGAKEA